MSGRSAAIRLGEFLIRRAVRCLPTEVRDEWFRTFAAELPVILDDPAMRSAFRRYARMLLCAADSIRGAWFLRGALATTGPRPVFTVAGAMIPVAAAISVSSMAILAIAVITTDIRFTLVLSEFVFGGIGLVSTVLFIRIAISRARRETPRDDTPLGGP